MFNITEYFIIIDKIIYNILSRTKKEILTFDILDTEKSKKNNVK